MQHFITAEINIDSLDKSLSEVIETTYKLDQQISDLRMNLLSITIKGPEEQGPEKEN